MKHKLTAGLFFSAVFVKYCIASFTRVKNQNIPPFFSVNLEVLLNNKKRKKKTALCKYFCYCFFYKLRAIQCFKFITHLDKP